MLRTTLCCVLIAATAAMAWQTLEQIPTTTQAGTRIACGKTTWDYYVWGIFPYGGRTRYGYCRVNTGSPQWVIDDAGNPHPLPFLDYTSATYQWQDNGVFFFSGHASNGDNLYFCDPSDPWDYPSSVGLPAAPGEGSCITYVPYGDDAGWVYYLSQSNQGSFHKYSLLSAENVVVDGICPGEGAITGDSTPLFQWGSTQTTQHRLLVASDSLFADTVIDEVVSSPEHQATTALTNGPYYWRSAAWVSSAWSWSGIHSFRVDAGWTTLSNRSDNTHGGVGAAMAYKGSFDGHPSILLLVGDGLTQFWEYNLQSDQWGNQNMGQTPKQQFEGTSLTTQDPTGEGGCFAWASFGYQEAGEFPYYYDANQHQWYAWVHYNNDPYYNSPYPENITFNASMVFGEPQVLYLETGDREFFRVDPPPDETLLVAEGQMASGSGVQRTQARVITRNGGFGVEYQLGKAAYVRALLHDAVGRQVGKLDIGEQSAGSHRLSWSTDDHGRKLSAGAYFVLLEIGTEQARLKAIVR